MLAVETACPGGTAGRKTAGEQGGNGKQGEGKLAHGSMTSQSLHSTAARLALLSLPGQSAGWPCLRKDTAVTSQKAWASYRSARARRRPPGSLDRRGCWRSEERRVGKDGVCTCRSRLSPVN